MWCPRICPVALQRCSFDKGNHHVASQHAPHNPPMTLNKDPLQELPQVIGETTIYNWFSFLPLKSACLLPFEYGLSNLHRLCLSNSSHNFNTDLPWTKYSFKSSISYNMQFHTIYNGTTHNQSPPSPTKWVWCLWFAWQESISIGWSRSRGKCSWYFSNRWKRWCGQKEISIIWRQK